MRWDLLFAAALAACHRERLFTGGIAIAKLGILFAEEMEPALFDASETRVPSSPLQGILSVNTSVNENVGACLPSRSFTSFGARLRHPHLGELYFLSLWRDKKLVEQLISRDLKARDAAKDHILWRCRKQTRVAGDLSNIPVTYHSMGRRQDFLLGNFNRNPHLAHVQAVACTLAFSRPHPN